MSEKLAELLKDEAVVKELLELETDEEVQKYLAAKDIELSLDEIKTIREGINARLNNSDELSDDQLEKVAGGVGMAGDIIDIAVDTICRIGDLVHSLTRRRW
ncbi:MAG: hypothetical protein IJT73_03890 [Selenomonadaceae bacterium]|nr:hypothetical protein [Selenomonadaceae bacterium]